MMTMTLVRTEFQYFRKIRKSHIRYLYEKKTIVFSFLDDSGADCVVCMCEIRDTIILPCRHLCLCYTCAESLRFQVRIMSFRIFS